MVTHSFWRVAGAVSFGFAAGIGIADSRSAEMVGNWADNLSAIGIGKTNQRFVFVQVAS